MRKGPLLGPVAPSQPTDIDARVVEGIEIFNKGRHWHAHEAWEGAWMDSTGGDRDFVQGLIMAAAMLVHYARGNPKGVANHWRNVTQRLPPHAPTKWGIDVARLLADLELYAESAQGPKAMDLDPAQVQIRRHDIN